jgi:hypothetical protein
MLSSKDREREGRTLLLEFHNFGRRLQMAKHLHNPCEISSFLTDIETDITLLSFRSKQLKTRPISRHKFFEF